MWPPSQILTLYRLPYAVSLPIASVTAYHIQIVFAVSWLAPASTYFVPNSWVKPVARNKLSFQFSRIPAAGSPVDYSHLAVVTRIELLVLAHSDFRTIGDANFECAGPSLQRADPAMDGRQATRPSGFHIVNKLHRGHPRPLRPRAANSMRACPGLIHTWLEIAVNSLLSLDREDVRRIWIVLDGLPTLHWAPALQPRLAESRHFGGCFVLSVQVILALRDLQGKNGAETILGLCGTRVVLAAPDRDTAQCSANSLGRS